MPIQWTFLSEDSWNESEYRKLYICIERAIGRRRTTSIDEFTDELEQQVHESSSSGAMSFREFWSLSFPEGTDRVDCLELCRKMTGRCATQLGWIAGDESAGYEGSLFDKLELQEAITVLCNDIALRLTQKETVKGGEGLEVEKRLVLKLLDMSEDDLLISRLVDYWGRFDAIKQSLLSHMRSTGLSMLGESVCVRLCG